MFQKQQYMYRFYRDTYISYRAIKQQQQQQQQQQQRKRNILLAIKKRLI